MKSIYSAVRTGASNKAVCASSLKGYGHTVLREMSVIKRRKVREKLKIKLRKGNSPRTVDVFAVANDVVNKTHSNIVINVK